MMHPVRSRTGEYRRRLWNLWVHLKHGFPRPPDRRVGPPWDFLREVRRLRRPRLQLLARVVPLSQEYVDAVSALTVADIPQDVRDQVTEAADHVYLALWPKKKDYSLFGRGAVRGAISTGAMALAAGDALAPEHRRALLDPWRQLGLRSLPDDGSAS